MSLQNVFDLAKKEFDKGNLECGYKASNGKLYTAYYTNYEWETFKDEMKQNYNSAYKDFKDGNGGELDEKGPYPPKMASYGSSSRFIFELSKEIQNFEFEKKLGICIPSKSEHQEAEASLDGYLPEKCIYVEAKCHEIYRANVTKFKSKYEEFYTYLSDRSNGLFKFEIAESKNKQGKISKNVHFFWKNKKITHFDCKQILCHLLGIAKEALTSKLSQASTLLYLVYKPSDDLLAFVENRDTATAIRKFWDIEYSEATTIDMSLLYNCVVHFLHEHKGIGLNLCDDEVKKIAKSFKFHFCTQDDYLLHLQ